jgi:hypothetical protein
MSHSAHCELMRSELLDLTTIVPATPCHQRNDVEQYSRFTLCTTSRVEVRDRTCCATTSVPEARHPGTVSALHATGILLAQLVFFHPLGRGFGEGVTKAHTLGHFEAGQTPRTPRL